MPSANPHEFGVPKHLWRLWLHQIGPGKSLSSASLPPAGHPETVSPSGSRHSPPGGECCWVEMHRVPAGHPRAWLAPGQVAGLASRHVGLGQASPSAALLRASLARTQRPALATKVRRFPSPGEELGKDPTAQVQQHSRAGGPASWPCQGLISWLIRCCFKSALIHPAPAGSQLESAFWAKSPGPGFRLPAAGIALPAAASAPGGAVAPEAVLPGVVMPGSGPPADCPSRGVCSRPWPGGFFKKTGIFILFFKRAFALLAKGPCIPFMGKQYLTGCCPKKTPNMFLITKNQEIFLLS